MAQSMDSTEKVDGCPSCKGDVGCGMQPDKMVCWFYQPLDQVVKGNAAKTAKLEVDFLAETVKLCVDGKEFTEVQ